MFFSNRADSSVSQESQLARCGTQPDPVTWKTWFWIRVFSGRFLQRSMCCSFVKRDAVEQKCGVFDVFCMVFFIYLEFL